MKINKEILDLKIKNLDKTISHSLTFRQWAREVEEELGIECASLDLMSDKDLDKYFLALLDLAWK